MASNAPAPTPFEPVAAQVVSSGFSIPSSDQLRKYLTDVAGLAFVGVAMQQILTGHFGTPGSDFADAITIWYMGLKTQASP